MLYCQQLENMNAPLQVNRPERRRVPLFHDNARPHTAKVTRRKLEELGWEVLPLPHLPYSPVLDPFDYHLLRWFHTKRFNNEADLKSDREVFFSSSSKKFSEVGILDLPKRWEYVKGNDSVYVID